MLITDRYGARCVVTSFHSASGMLIRHRGGGRHRARRLPNPPLLLTVPFTVALFVAAQPATAAAEPVVDYRNTFWGNSAMQVDLRAAHDGGDRLHCDGSADVTCSDCGVSDRFVEIVESGVDTDGRPVHLCAACSKRANP